MKRIAVEGTRGKSEVVTLLDTYLTKRKYAVLSKVTGLEPILRVNGTAKPIDRRAGFFLDHENRRCLRLAKDKDVVVFENQAISMYTMRLFHNLLKPEMILIPNIRLEHQEGLGGNLKAIAESFAVHFDIPSLQVIITTEQKEPVLEVLRSYAKRYGKRLVGVKYAEDIPSIGNLYLVDEALKQLLGSGLTKLEWKEHQETLRKRFSIKCSTEGIKYFISSKVNDVSSSFATYAFLSKNYPQEKLCYVAYFRADRKDRALSFIPFFNAVGKQRTINKIFLRGDFCSYVYKKLEKPVQDKTMTIEKARIRNVLDYCKRTGSVLVTSVNGVNGFMKQLEGRLQS